jgi:prepilin-type N-terminal cleavage/methylation domain-containing protein
VKRRHRRGFSLVEMLVALTITATLLTAALTALDAGFKGYKFTTDGASTHVVSRITMHRMMAMIRTGTDFAPYPVDPLDSAQNPVVSDFIEFHGALPADGSVAQRVIRIEKRAASPQVTPPIYELWYVQDDFDESDHAIAHQARPLLTNLQDVRFTLQYDVGQRLERATVDMTVRPNDGGGAAIYTSLEFPTIRFVSTVSPRRFETTD